MRVVDPPVASVGGHELDRFDVAGGEAVAASEPADSAAERVADDADVRRGAGQGGKTVGGRRLDHIQPQSAGLHPGDPPRRVDPDPSHGVSPEQLRVRERPERSSVVTGPLRRDAQAPCTGVGDRSDHIVRGLGPDHRRGTLVDGQVRRAARAS